MASLSRLIAGYPSVIRRQAKANGEEAAAFLEARLKGHLDTPYPPASRPGAYPARRTGRLRREAYAKSEVKGTAVVITVALPTPYAAHLAAAGRLGPRAVIEESRAEVGKILARKGRARA